MGMQTAKKLADVLQQNPERTVLIEGFTDSTVVLKHNQQLSQRRATAVKTALLQMNVAAGAYRNAWLRRSISGRRQCNSTG
jgi:outer membrane protein OmpA-like peptidoglycan-associated protein